MNILSSKRAEIELFFLSCLALYLELFAIRWICADIRAFTVLRTLPLITCFVGLGIGFALRSDRPFKYIPYALVAFVGVMKLADARELGFYAFPSTAVFHWQNLVYSSPISVQQVLLFMLLIPLALAPSFALMLCAGARLGTLFDQMRPLPAYCLNILGSLAGTIAFTALSFCQLNPLQLLLPAILLIVIYLPKPNLKAWAPLVIFLAIPIIFMAAPAKHAKPLASIFVPYQTGDTITYWSPYQRIDLSILSAADRLNNKPHFFGLELGVNRAFYQYFFSKDATSCNIDPAAIASLKSRIDEYALPYRLGSTNADVLVVGAGTGQNVSAALANGASRIDAVDIDPVILKVGKQYNPSYSEPNVQLICDDARHYFEVCKKTYDLINFSLLDSHAVTGQGSSVRIDSYVYTKESIEKALSLLKPNGIIVVSFALNPQNRWIGERIARTLNVVAGYPPLMLSPKEHNHYTDTIFVIGNPVKNNTLILPSDWKGTPGIADSDVRILTDDWPYLYVRSNVLDTPYLLVVGEIVLISFFLARRFLVGKHDRLNWQMFFLGAAFLLLELHAISFLSLLYGSTWLTSAIVISGILIMILLANLLVILAGQKITNRQQMIYLFLFLSILLSFFTPGSAILAGGNLWSRLLMTVITVLPMGVAAILFASVFSQAKNSSRALAFNLFGALLGGLLEYLSNYTGIKALELVALLLYGCSMLAMLRGNNQLTPPE